MRKGLNTTEFYLTLLSMLGAFSAALADLLDPEYAVVASTLSSIFYLISRTFLKGSGPNKEAAEARDRQTSTIFNKN
jgi:hypothetical protein